jgi:hypothetical protein
VATRVDALHRVRSVTSCRFQAEVAMPLRGPVERPDLVQPHPGLPAGLMPQGDQALVVMFAVPIPCRVAIV